MKAMTRVRNDLVKKICAILVIIVLMLSDFWIVGESVVIYAIDTAKTDNKNVEFTAYFLDEKGQEVDNKNSYMSVGEEDLYLKIKVKNEGYFSGIVEIENKNFEIDTNELDKNILELTEDGKLVLKQINAGTEKIVKLKIKPIKNDVVKLDELENNTKIKLTGDYINSQNIEKNKADKIAGETEVKIDWISSGDSTVKIDGKVFTNKIYSVDSTDRKIVQFLIENDVKPNNYPIKKREIELSELNGIQEVEVINENGDELKFERKNGTIKIVEENDNKDEIKWNPENIIVTYITNSEADTINKDIQINEKIELYDEKVINSSKIMNTGEEKEGEITYEVESEKEIYKGKIQTGEKREYTTKVKINVNYEKIANKILIEEKETNYKIGNREEIANIVYKKLIINKKDFLNLLGEDGFIIVKDANGTIIKNINKNSKENDAGNVEVNFETPTTKVEIECSKPIKEGTLVIENVKEIEEGKNVEIIKKAEKIVERIICDGKEQIKEIEVKNTSSKAKLEVSTNTLSTLETNKNVKMTVTLLNSNETQDLYKNPKIRIKLPEEIKEVNAKCKLLYGNGLKLDRTQIVKENEKYVLEADLNGTQTNYNTETVEGTTLVIYADLKLDQLATNASKEIELNYTNDNVTTYVDEGKETSEVKIKSKTGVIATNAIEEYGISTIGTEKSKELQLEAAENDKEVKVKIDTINNEQSKIEGVKILGYFPTKKADDIGIRLKSGINIGNKEGVKVYYSDVENPTKDLENEKNAWKEDGSIGTAKSYLIVVDSMEVGEKLEANYDIVIPSIIKKNTKATESYKVMYKNTGTGKEESSNSSVIRLIAPATINVKEEADNNDIQMSIRATSGNTLVGEGISSKALEFESIKTGEIIKYEVTLKNVSATEKTNVQITEIVPDNAVILDYRVLDEQTDGAETDGLSNRYYVKNFKEISPKQKTTKVDKIAPNETVVVNLYAMCKSVGTLTTEIQAKYEDKTIVKYVMNEVQKSSVEVELMAANTASDVDYIGLTENGEQNEYEFVMEIRNTTGNNLTNVKAEFLSDTSLEIDKIVRTIYNDDEDAGSIEEKEKNYMTFDIKAYSSEQINVYIKPKADTKAKTTWLYGKVTENEKEVRSNLIGKSIGGDNESKLNLKLEATKDGETIEPNEEVEFTLTLKNGQLAEDIHGLDVKFNTYWMMEIQKVYLDETELKQLSDEDIDLDEEDENNSDDSDDYGGDWTEYVLSTDDDMQENVVTTNINLKKGETRKIKIIAKLDESARDYIEEDTGFLSIYAIGYDKDDTDKTITDVSNSVEHFISASDDVNDYEDDSGYDENDDPENPTNPSNPSNPSNPNNSSNPNNQNNSNNPNNSGNSSNGDGSNNSGDSSYNASGDISYNDIGNISGVIWKDENKNGRKEPEEEKIGGITVKLVDEKLAEIISTTTTDSMGSYEFDIDEKGSYMVIFELDMDYYMPTIYQEEGIEENRNSDAIISKVTLNGEERTAIATDSIVVNGNSVENIDLGLLDAQIFDLDLKKEITDVTVVNDEGTKVINFNDSDLARVELNTKYVNNTKIIAVYKITVTNIGEVAGYARKIVDYKPSDMNFDETLNNGWYQEGNNLYSETLADTKIDPGASCELLLTLTKTMTSENLGLINNIAEIAESYNIQGIPDNDLIAKKGQNGENESNKENGSCNLTIGIKTGGVTKYITFIISTMILIIAALYLTYEKLLKKKIKM